MRTFIRNLYLFLRYGKKKYLLYGSIVICEKGSALHIGKRVKLRKCNIRLYETSELYIEKDVIIINTTIKLKSNKNECSIIGAFCQISDAQLCIKGRFEMGKGNIINKGYYFRPVKIDVTGTLFIGENNRLRSDIKCRYNSALHIGNHNNINEESEIRCDEQIFIGDFNQISYQCNIWDTNTHNIYKAEKRREITVSKYPSFGYEYEKPKTKAVRIGNDNWIGKNVTILKGTCIEDKCVIGYGTLLSSVKIPSNRTVVQNHVLTILKNEV